MCIYTHVSRLVPKHHDYRGDGELPNGLQLIPEFDTNDFAEVVKTTVLTTSAE